MPIMSDRWIRRMALEQRFIGTRILRELTAQGYRGGKTALHVLSGS